MPKRKYSKRRSEMTPEEQAALDAHNLEVLDRMTARFMMHTPLEPSEQEELATTDPEMSDAPDIHDAGNGDSASL